MKDINWNEMPEWADSYCEIDQYNIFWMNDEQYQYTHGDPEIYKFSGESAHNLSDAKDRTYPPKQSEEIVDETQSIRAILEEAFNKAYEQYGVRLVRVGFNYTRKMNGGVSVLDVDVEGSV